MNNIMKIITAPTLILMAGTPATAEPWLEITVTNAWVLPDFFATGCDAARQQARGDRVWPGFGDTLRFDSSNGVLSPNLQDLGLWVGQWLAEPWWICSHGWMDMVELRSDNGSFFLYAIDADFVPDTTSKESHPRRSRISSVAAWGLLDGFNLATINDKPVKIRRADNMYTVSINTTANDIDRNGIIGVPDIFAYLSLWFSNDIRADRDGGGMIDVPDIYMFLNEWFEEVGL
jgi:hypothetical protein